MGIGKFRADGGVALYYRGKVRARQSWKCLEGFGTRPNKLGELVFTGSRAEKAHNPFLERGGNHPGKGRHGDEAPAGKIFAGGKRGKTPG